MLSPGPVKDLATKVAFLVHSERKLEAAKEIADFSKLAIDFKNSSVKVDEVLANWLHWLLNNGAPEEAAQLLWTPNQFTPEPQCTKDVWALFDSATQGLIMGGGSLSKSFSMGVRLFLEWIRDPAYTTVRVIGPSQSHLEANLFSNLVGLHQEASLPMPGSVGELFIGESRRNMLGSIAGLVIPIGQTRKSGRIQGAKRHPRAKAHPIFGALSRFFIFIDEFEVVPKGLHLDITNILSQVAEEGEPDNFRIFGAWNPSDASSEVAKLAEPEFGWNELDPDVHYKWRSIRGWDVIRLDGEKCENVIQGKVVYPGLQTRAGLAAMAKNGGGRDSAGYCTMGRGVYPKFGVEMTVIPAGMWPKWIGEFIWYSEPRPVGACDLALEGGAGSVMTLGKFGLASGIKFKPTIDFPNGKIFMFRNKIGTVTPRYGLQADQQFVLPKGDSVAMTDQLINVLRKAGVTPDFFACDRTGHGAGVADMVKNQWGSAIHDVNYSDAASESKLMIEDSQTCREQFERVVSELWFALRAWGEFQHFVIAPTMELAKITPQITQRKTKTGKKSRVESKADYVDRGHQSPDEADSLTLFVHAARKGSGLVLSRSGGAETPDNDDRWYDGGYYGGQHIDVSNRTEVLDL